MNRNKLCNLIEIIILLIVIIISVVLLFILNPTSSLSYKIFVILNYCLNPIIHLIFVAIKLAKKISFRHKTYDETFISIIVIYGVLLTYIINYIDKFEEYYYIFYILLIIPLLLSILFFYLAKRKDHKELQNKKKLKLSKKD